MYPRPTQPFGLGSPLFSHSLGVSVVPPAMTTTLASSVVDAPLTVSRQVTAVARSVPLTVEVPMLVAKAFGIRVTALPWGAHEPARPAVSAIGM